MKMNIDRRAGECAWGAREGFTRRDGASAGLEGGGGERECEGVRRVIINTLIPLFSRDVGARVG